MPDTPHDIQFPLADFDRGQLPEDQRGLEGDAYLQAIREHLIGQFVGQGGAAEVAVTHDRVIIRWKESDKAESLAKQGTNHLKQGNTEKGIATLQQLGDHPVLGRTKAVVAEHLVQYPPCLIH